MTFIVRIAPDVQDRVEAVTLNIGPSGDLVLYDEGGWVTTAYAAGQWAKVIRLEEPPR